jgi:RNA polymerase sigma-70 factor (ECF subfamily)
MSQDKVQERLSRISTLWSMVYQAHQGAAESVTAAQRALMERYSGAARRYLLGALRDADAADDLYQDFCLRFLRGDFRAADPERGRFRDFLKTALFHLIIDYQRQRRPLPLGDEEPEPGRAAPPPDSEAAFLESWREQLMDRTWVALAEVERESGVPSHTVLRCRTDQPLLSSAELAEQLGARLGKTLSVPALRQALYRAREKFAELLVTEVAQSLQHPDRAAVEEELSDLGLLSYCRSALDRVNLRGA